MKLVEINNQDLSKIDRSWRGFFDDPEKESQEFSEAYLSMLDSAKWHFNELEKTQKNGGTIWRYFALVDEHKKYHALAHASHVFPNTNQSYLKFMTIRTNPEYDSRNQLESTKELDRIKKLWYILTGFVISMINILFDNSYNIGQVKLYGNTQMDMSFFTLLIQKLDGDIDLEKKVVWDFAILKSYRGWLQIDKK